MESEALEGRAKRPLGGWLARVSIGVKLTLAFGLILVLFLITVLQTFDNYQKVGAARAEIVRNLKTILLVNELYTLAYASVIGDRVGATGSDALSAAKARAAGVEDVSRHLDSLESMTADDLDRQRELRKLLDQWRIELMAGTAGGDAGLRVLQSARALRQEIQQIDEARLAEQEAAEEQRSRWLQLELIVMLFAGLIVGISAMLYSGRRLTDPLVALSGQMREVAAGRTGIEIHEQGRDDEIGTVARALEVFRQARVAADQEAGNKARLLLELRTAYAELEAITEDLTRANQYKSEFMATVSHELRTPLTSILGSLGLIAAGAVGPLTPQAKNLLSIAQSNSGRLLALINDLLDLEKIEAGKIRLELSPIELVPIVEQALLANQGYAQKHGVTYVMQALPVDQVCLAGDAKRLGQVLANLLSNAAKFAPEGSQVEVGIAVAEGRARVSVRDRGPGVPAEFRARIFQKFSQADSSDQRQKGGTGLGLSISKAIVEMHHGRIGFDSVPGDTTFWFELPLDKPSRRQARARVLVLVMEKDPDTAALLTALLKKSHYDPNIAGNVSSAKRLVTERSYDMLLLGRLPSGEDGFALLSELRRQPDWGGLQVLMASKQAHDAIGHLDNILRLAGWRLPVEPSEAPARRRVLQVDDDPSQITLLRAHFGPSVDLSAAGTIAEARDLLGRQAFDLVILDLMLPDGTGYELLPLMQNRFPATPVVIFSAHDSKPYAARQVAAVVAKSGDRGQDLKDLVRAVLGTST